MRDVVHERVIRNFERVIGGRPLREVAAERGVDWHRLRMAAMGRRRRCRSDTIELLARGAGVDPAELLRPV